MTSTIPDFSHITTIMFDLDGTLIEHTWQLDKITTTLFSRFAEKLTPLTHDEFYQQFWPRNEEMWHMLVDGVIDGDTATKYAYIHTLRALGQDTSLAEAMLATWQELVLSEALPFADTFTVLAAVRGRYTTGIVTNGVTTLQRRKIERHNLAGYVDFTLVSEEAGYHKPDKRIFLRALQLAGNPLPEQTLYIGDNPLSDIVGAQGAGLIPILMSSDNQAETPAGVTRIGNLSDLLPLLKL
ncbi:MAG: HAD-IA family hydrolase [Chloroflexota bacterium]